jgi:hypothetical protein
MTIGIKVSANGNYKVPVKVVHQYGTEEHFVVSGRGHEGPKVQDIPFYHGSPTNVVTITVGPESADNGEEVSAT